MRPEISPAGLTRRTSRRRHVWCLGLRVVRKRSLWQHLTQTNLRIRTRRSWPNQHSGHTAAGPARALGSGLLFEIPRSLTGPCAERRAGRFGRSAPAAPVNRSMLAAARRSWPAACRRTAPTTMWSRSRSKGSRPPARDTRAGPRCELPAHRLHAARFVQSQLGVAVFDGQARQVAAAITRSRRGEQRHARSPRRSWQTISRDRGACIRIRTL